MTTDTKQRTEEEIQRDDFRAAEIFARMAIDEPIEDIEFLFKLVNQPYRVASADGTDYILTQDFRPDRINLQLTKGKVTNATRG